MVIKSKQIFHFLASIFVLDYYPSLVISILIYYQLSQQYKLSNKQKHHSSQSNCSLAVKIISNNKTVPNCGQRGKNLIMKIVGTYFRKKKLEIVNTGAAYNYFLKSPLVYSIPSPRKVVAKY